MASFIQSNPIIIPAELANHLATGWLNQEHTGMASQPLNSPLAQRLQLTTKKAQPLRKIDHYMLEETTALLQRLAGFCRSLLIDESIEFEVVAMPATALEVATHRYRHLPPQQLTILGDFAHREQLVALINQDQWFVGAFAWLRPNFTSLAYSFEALEYSTVYRFSPDQADAQYAHFLQHDKGMAFMLKHAAGNVTAQVESPRNLYHI